MDEHDLYGLPFDRFVPERTALARALRTSGDRKGAEAVAALRKPSVSAWAVNQLVRTQSRTVAELFAAGDAARRAQTDLLSGQGRGEALRDALTHEREAVGDLIDVARGLLGSEGHELSPAMLTRVADTLHAAALGEEARVQVAGGCLRRDLRHVGLAGMEGAPAAAPRRRVAAQPAKDHSALRKAEGAARRVAERAARAADAARAKRDAAANALQAAEAELATAEEAAAEAETALAQARRELN
jgi:hypothetical protein